MIKSGGLFIGIAMRLLVDDVVSKVQHMRDARLGNDMAPPLSPPPPRPNGNFIYYTSTKIISQTHNHINFSSLKSWIS